MTHLPYSTDFPKPGDTLTAAQANSLPVGSHVEWLKSEYQRRADGWFAVSGTQSVFVDNNLCESESPYTLLRVGPPAPQFTVGQMVTVTQMAALPNRSRVKYDAWSDGFFLEKSSAGWSDQSGRLASSLDGPYRLLRIGAASPACPHAEGSLAWARWMAREQGKCVQCEGSSLFKFIDGRFHYWAASLNKWINNNGICGSIEEWPGPWSVVPDPSLPAETPVVHIDPAAIAEALDEIIPNWRNGSYGRCVHQVIAHLGYLIGEYKKAEDDAAGRISYETERREELKAQIATLTAERDRLRTENADLLATADALKRESVRSEYWKTLRGQLPDEVACHDNEALVSSAYHWLNEYRQERDAAISEIGKSCAALAAAHADEIKGIAAERDAALARAEKAEKECGIVEEAVEKRDSEIDEMQVDLSAALERAEKAEQLLTLRHAAWQPRVVVPEDVRGAAFNLLYSMDEGKCAAGKFILSLAADHLPDAGQMVQPDHIADAGKMMPFTSAHPEGSREWAEDAMRAGLAVANKGKLSYRQHPDGTFRCLEDGDMWGFGEMLDTGWRIHTPAVAPEPLPSIAQIWARIAAIEERLGDVEAGV